MVVIFGYILRADCVTVFMFQGAPKYLKSPVQVHFVGYVVAIFLPSIPYPTWKSECSLNIVPRDFKFFETCTQGFWIFLAKYLRILTKHPSDQDFELFSIEIIWQKWPKNLQQFAEHGPHPYRDFPAPFGRFSTLRKGILLSIWVSILQLKKRN